MRKNQVEIWAVRVLESMARAGQTEDHHVEFKGEWIEPRRAARRLAGHANSAPDEHILWVIGVDENTGEVRGAREQELSVWWQQVEAEFADGIAPEMTAVGMKWDDAPIVAIVFRTDRAPYVVKNPEHGKTKGHSIAWEVPMRVGTRVETATRSQLLGLLAPTLRLPRYELIAASATLQTPVRLEDPKLRSNWAQRCEVDARFYLISQGAETITLDSNSCEVVVAIPMFRNRSSLGLPILTPIETPNVTMAGNICRFTDIAHLHLRAVGDIASIGNALAEELHLEIRLRPIGQERKVVIAVTLRPQEFSPAAGLTHAFVLNKKGTD